MNNIKEEVDITAMSANLYDLGSANQITENPELVALENIKAELDKIQDSNIEVVTDVPEATKTEVVIEETPNVKVESIIQEVEVSSIMGGQSTQNTSLINSGLSLLSDQATTIMVGSEFENKVLSTAAVVNAGVKRPATSSPPPQMKVIIQKNPTTNQTQPVLFAQSMSGVSQSQLVSSGGQGFTILSPSVQGASTPTKTITLSQAGIVSPGRTIALTSLSSTPPRSIIPQQKIAISPAKTPTKITMIPVSGKSPHRVIPLQHVAGSNVLTMIPKNALITTTASSVSGTVIASTSTKTITYSPQRVFIRQPFSVGGKPQTNAAGQTLKQITIPLQNTQNVQQIQVPGSKFNYIRLVSTPASQQQAQTQGNKQATIAPAGQAKQMVPLSVGNTTGQTLKFAVAPKPAANQTSTAQPQTQRLLLPATSTVQIRASAAPTQSLAPMRPVTTATSTALSQLPPGTTLISTGGNVSGVQGFALVPAQYISNLQQQAGQSSQPAQQQSVQSNSANNKDYIPIASNDMSVSNAVASRHLNGSSPMETPGGQRPRKPCNCTKSQCLKLYCDCFANGEFCHNCNCTNCANNLEHEDERSRAIKSCLDRNPHAFHPKIGKGTGKIGDGDRRHNKGCNCKKSGCLKNYCECYEAKITCSSMCRCVGCKNFDESPERKTLMHLADAAEVRVQQQTSVRTKLSSQMQDVPSKHSLSGAERLPYTFITSDVAEATCVCMLAQAEDAERTRQPPVIHERAILEEFGRCLMQIIESANRTKAGGVSIPLT
ncbi:protein lin-54 homolog isoform X2 [Lineus longissimus]